MKEIENRWYLLKRDDVQEMPIEAMMDMLRYDGARVHCNGPDGFWLLSTDGEPCEARWKSFGIQLFAISLWKTAHRPMGNDEADVRRPNSDWSVRYREPIIPSHIDNPKPQSGCDPLYDKRMDSADCGEN